MGGITKPKALPTGLATDAIEVAIERWIKNNLTDSGLNHILETLAGALRRKG